MDAEDIFSFARRQCVGTMVSMPLAQGLLTGKYAPDAAFGAGDARSRVTRPVLEAVRRGLQPLRERLGPAPEDLARVGLHFCLRRWPDAIVLAGFSSAQQVTVNYEGLTTELSSEDYDFVHTVYESLCTDIGALDPALQGR